MATERKEKLIRVLQILETTDKKTPINATSIVEKLENEYNVEIRMDTLPYEHVRWIENEDINMDKIVGTSDMKKIQDLKGRPLLLFVNSWSVGMVLDRNEGLVLSEFGRE